MSTYFGTVNGLIEKQTFKDEEGNEFEKYFDAVGNLIREVKYFDGTPDLDNPNAAITDYKYDSLYRVRKIKTPNTKIITYSYDGFERQSARSTPDAGITYFTYDKNNNLIYSQDANQRSIATNIYTFRSYDALNRLTALGETTVGTGAVNYDNINIDSTYAYTLELDNPATNFYLTINAFDSISNSVIGIFEGVNGYIGHNFTKGKLAATAYRTRLTDTWNFKYYRYDVRGRVIRMWNVISGFDTLVTDYQYNSQDQVTIYSHSRDSEVKTFKNSYDYAGRLTKVEFYVGWPDAPDPTYISLVDYSYNENSQISQQHLNDGGIKNNYYYNNRKWISEKSGGSFDFINDYFKNGNVKGQEFSGTYNDNFSNTTDLSFDYTYDKSNRLLNIIGLSGKSYDLENTYDKDGNLVTLKRYGSAGTLDDNFTYTYYSGTNRLQKVYGSTSQYTYDANGNMKTDEVNRNRDIKYDYRNLITQIRNKKIVIEDSLVYLTYYFYDEAGNRIRKKVYQYIGIQQPDSVASPDTEAIGDAPGIWELINDIIYSRGVDGNELAIFMNGNLEQSTIWGLGNEGYITSSDFPNFYAKDHLGSIRAVSDENNSVISSQDYDAWGYLLQSRIYESNQSIYKFTGKERDKENNYDYFGARYYDARVGNWTSLDPLMEKHIDYSPYNYVLRNPFKLVDPDGRQVEIITRTYIPQESSVNPLYKVFHDNRSADYYSNSYRTEQRMIIVPNESVSPNIVTSFSNDIGETWAISTSIPYEVIVSEGKGNLSKPEASRVSETSVNVSIIGEAWETLPPAILPSIDYSINYFVSENNDGSYNIVATGTEDGFPAYEIWARNLKTGGKPILIYNRENESAYELPKLLDDFYDVDFRREEILR
jgi:RHS repeat-associated protein